MGIPSDLQDAIITRLSTTGVADEPWALSVVAAMDGDAALECYLDKSAPMTMPAAPPATATVDGAKPEPPGAYVAGITVEGFRGIGPKTTIPIEPGPGLTLVVGRNGSGKSSFAEGFELLLTGQNLRWEKPRTKEWREGWKNLHAPGPAALSADMVVEKERGTVTLSRRWTGDDLAGSTATVSRTGKSDVPLDSMGWSDALSTFRPFLSYNEVGSLLEEGPSKLYDALSSILGLDALVAVGDDLAAARKKRKQRVDDARDGAAQLAAAASDHAAASGDARFVQLETALKRKTLDLPAVEALVAPDTASEPSDLSVLRDLSALQPPSLDVVAATAAGLREAELACAAFEGTDAARARELASLLERALAFHAGHVTSDCPVCGTADQLSAEWRARTEAEVSRLKQESAACDAAMAQRRARVADAVRLLRPMPVCVAPGTGVELPGLDALRAQWTTWTAGQALEAATALAAHLEQHVVELDGAVSQVVAVATEEAKRRDDAWRPLAARVTAWLPVARAAEPAAAALKELKAAEDWWKEALAAIRDERFDPIADQAVRIWGQLRLQSNVDLGRPTLGGTGKGRKVALGVTVDGMDASALGVMSQGELHALALSLFLPRATLPESPFRFVWIDDPVQSMDPARVDGLARVLDDVARTRQVVVFTHDDRLPEAVRRLGIKATVFGVSRRAQSVVHVTPLADPVSVLLDDAYALVKTDGLSRPVALRAVGGFCRAAMEAACMETIRRRRLGRGDAHIDVEQLLLDNAAPHPLMALALLDDESRTNELLGRMNTLAGPVNTDTFQLLKQSSHDSYRGDVGMLLENAKNLVHFIRSRT